MPFKLWPAQLGVMYALMAGRLVLILKARQLGISWLCCWYALWLMLFHPGKVVLIFSKGQDEASVMLERIKKLYQRLPDWMLAELPTIERDNTTEIVFSNGSMGKSLPATKSAGRSLTASLVILDEAAFLAWADELYTALKPTIDGGGQLIILSTANGIGNLFHQLWVKAAAGLNKFKAMFLPWWSRPGRDAAWYADQEREYTDPRMVKQEYPATAVEAFLVSGRTRFDPDWIAGQAQHVRAPIAKAKLPAGLTIIPGLGVYQLPVAGRRYVIGADVAEGVEGGDYSTAVVLDAETWEEVASLHGSWEPDQFAVYAHLLSDAYNAALLGVERNNHGHAVLVTLRARHCTRVAVGLDGKPGWLTNAQSKPLSIDALAVGLRDGLIKVHTAAAIDEMHIYRVLKDGGTGAPTGYHDDRVMAWAIALMLAKRPALRKAGSRQG